MKHIILSILFSLALLTSCEKHRNKIKVYETTNQKGYCYNDGLLWYIFYYDALTNSYRYQGTSTYFTAYNDSSTVDWVPSPETVSNYSENQTALEQSSYDIQESSGENAGGSDFNNESTSESNDSGISESSGESSGGSDSGSSDSGSSDSGGGDGGGGE